MNQIRKKIENLPPEQNRLLSGLENMGNTCYLNAVLQILSSTDLFSVYLLNKQFIKDLIFKFKYEKKLSACENVDENELRSYIKQTATYQTYVLICHMWKENCRIYPNKLLKLIKEKMELFSTFGQYDSSEFLMCFFDKIENEVGYEAYVKETDDMTQKDQEFKNAIFKIKNKIKTTGSKEFIDELINIKKENLELYAKLVYTECWKRHLKCNKYSFLQDIFTFNFIGLTQCSNCENKEVNFEFSNVLNLSLNKEGNSVLNELIKEECFKVEDLTEENKYECGICESKQDAKRILQIWNLPDKLIICLKRFECVLTNVNGQMIPKSKKINTNISFPLQLEMKNYLCKLNKNEKKTKYELYGLIAHQGGLNKGHYVSYVKNILSSKWFLFDDDEVYHIDKEDLVTSNPYMLFYEKLKNESII